MKENFKWLRSCGKASPAFIKEIEDIFNIKYPQKYKEYVLLFNGSVPAKKFFLVSGEECKFNRLINFDKTIDWNFFERISFIKNKLPNNIIPFGDDSFGNLICFDFNNNIEPKIVFWEHELNKTIYLEKDFNSFIGSLTLED